MKRLSTTVLAVAVAACAGLPAVAAPKIIAQATPAASPGAPTPAAATPAASPATTTPTTTTPANTAPASTTTPPMQFGNPPSGMIPILFNDHHVYSKPDVLRKGRVLAALVRGGTILIPLRSMFEQMGATVSYDPATRTVHVTKPGSDVQVTLGKAEVTINGETRPLDVPPMMYQGTILVPVRVISEGMGAYVQWVADRHLVAIRYAPPAPPTEAPPPPPAPAPVPTTAPTATPAPAVYNDHFIAGDYIISPKVYNEFSPGNTGKGGSYSLRGALEFNLLNLPWMIEGDMRQYSYPHNCTTVAPAPTGDQCNVTNIGATGQYYSPAFTAKDQDIDARLGLRVLQPRIYVGVGYLWRNVSYGYPQQRGIGYGLEKLPDLDKAFSIYGSAYYYPNLRGNCTNLALCPNGPLTLSYSMLKYEIGGTLNFGNPAGVFLDFGWLGDRLTNKTNAPSDASHNGPYVGLGIHF